ncbi:hypothetical protein P22_3244 [Propionispora sp. 2/2-37]|nr:hypothetical protein [Propionispora sp. 2/2-37]CUH97118.1 hypothetical protein P22_3244 [Propionispora sp. 2/2-37]
METKEDSIAGVIKEMYGIASELSISRDKETKVLGMQLRKLIEQLEQKIG